MKPIIFTGASILGILDGSKTMTRRVVKPQPGGGFDWCRVVQVAHWYHIEADLPRPVMHTVTCPYGVPGDRMYVRETWRQSQRGPEYIVYKADYSQYVKSPHGRMYRTPMTNDRGSDIWKSPIHMPRWASRIMLEIVNVRVERLQDITEDDARAEGFQLNSIPNRDAFEFEWDYINSKRGYTWKSNPWVWVYQFKVVK